MRWKSNEKGPTCSGPAPSEDISAPGYVGARIRCDDY